MSDLAELGESGQLGVWYNPLTWFDGLTAGAAVTGVATAMNPAFGQLVSGQINKSIPYADAFFRGQIYSGLEREKDNLHARYRELRDSRNNIFDLTGANRSRAEQAFSQAKNALDAGTKKLNEAILKHDETLATVKKYSYILRNDTMPDLQKVGFFEAPRQGLSGLGDLGNMGAGPLVVGVGAWIVTNPILFTVSAVALAALIALLGTYAAGVFLACLAALTAFLALLPGMESFVDKFKQMVGVVTAPIRIVGEKVALIGGIAVVGFLGFLYFRSRKK